MNPVSDPMSSNAVETINLTVKFGDFTAVHDLSFSVKRGEIFGFLGANGAGKTTTIRVLCGLLVPTQGQARIAGIEVNAANAVFVKTKVGYMSQKFTLYDDLTVGENLDFVASLRKLEPTTEQKRRQDLLEFISFKKPLQTLVKDLPGGMKQQVSLIASMLHDPEIVFLDEPTAGVSPWFRAKFWDLIRRLSNMGKTIFVTSHYMDEAQQCQRIALMRAGEIIALDSPDNLKRSAFPKPLFELNPIKDIPRGQMERWKTAGVFQSLEPYGLRYHAVIANPAGWEKFQHDNREIFEIRAIAPSLEDVFIKLITH